MESVRYLTLEEAIALHALIMAETGYPPAPLRSQDLLASAITRPRNLAHYQSADLVEQAANLEIGISQNQPFLDGNKRTAYVVMLTFMEINGFTIDAEPLQIAEHLVQVAERSSDRDKTAAAFAAWVRERLRAIDPSS